MAVMIPEKPNVFQESSLENVMFDALEKLPEEYYVFHSFRITKVISHTIHERTETTILLYFIRKKEFFVLKQKQDRYLIKMDIGYMETDNLCIMVDPLNRPLLINGS